MIVNGGRTFYKDLKFMFYLDRSDVEQVPPAEQVEQENQ